MNQTNGAAVRFKPVPIGERGLSVAVYESIGVAFRTCRQGRRLVRSRRCCLFCADFLLLRLFSFLYGVGILIICFCHTFPFAVDFQ